MAIKKFNQWLKHRYPLAHQTSTVNTLPKIDNLYIDFNELVHVNMKISPKNREVGYKQRFKKLIKRLEQTIDAVRPQKLIYIASDGVAPLAKVNTQKVRRLKIARKELGFNLSTQTEEEINEMLKKIDYKKINELNSSKEVTSISITPGTEFMHKLYTDFEKYVLNKLNSNTDSSSNWKKPQIILSGHLVPGEGEHKIMDYIRLCKTKKDYNPNLKHAVLGSDADITLLTLSTHEPSFIIIRPTENSISNTFNLKFETIYISLLRECIIKEFYTKKAKFKVSEERILDDFILLAAFNGNDYVPSIYGINVEYGGFDRLLEVYAYYLEHGEGHFLFNGEINFKNLFYLFELVSQIGKKKIEKFMKFEQIVIKEAETYFEKKMVHKATLQQKLELSANTKFPIEIKEKVYEYINLSTYLKQLASACENASLVIHNHDMIKIDFPEEEQEYSVNIDGKDKLNVNYLNGNKDVNIKIKDYLKSLQYTIYYIFRGMPSWDWFYPGGGAIRIENILKAGIPREKFEFTIGKPLSPYAHLLALMPRNHAHELPELLQDLMLNPKSELYNYYDLFNPGVIDPHKITRCVLGKAKKFSDEQKRLNRWCLPYRIVKNHGKYIYQCSKEHVIKAIEYNHCIDSMISPDFKPYLGIKSGFYYLNSFPSVTITQSLSYNDIKREGRTSMSQLIYLSSPISHLSVQYIAKLLLNTQGYFLNFEDIRGGKICSINTKDGKFYFVKGELKYDAYNEGQRRNFAKSAMKFEKEYLKKYNIILGPIPVMLTYLPENNVKTAKRIKLFPIMLPLQTLCINTMPKSLTEN
ncbi:hypothetical protein K502DRAFT_366797 [Neoconidiobolus thromboides FSU 785]|nr:hypothetical protein K502DRAFT_366797 [Neoconidiobolus thromboides FSU 785]